MWIKRDFSNTLQQLSHSKVSVKVLKGPRQVGKTSLLNSLQTHQLVLFDDHILRARAEENPSLFLEQFKGPLLLDEATLVPSLFLEIKKRVDEAKRKQNNAEPIDYWITGSNQTLLSRFIQDSLAGRADYFNLNTLSIHEHKKTELSFLMMRGGWPELHVDSEKNSVHYLNNLISTFIEKDIVQAAGIEKKSAFTKTLQLLAGQVSGLINFSSISSAVGVEATTVQSWALILEQNGLIKILPPFMNTLNKRLIKTPKIYFEEVSLAARFQGWTSFEPLYVSPYFGHLVENIAYSEIARFFINTAQEQKIYYLRNKEKVEVDFLVELPNQKYVAIEVKSSPRDFSKEQMALLESLGINIVGHWIVSPIKGKPFGTHKVLGFDEVFENLAAAVCI